MAVTDRFDFHVFAHRDGRYQTVAASAGVTTPERSALEQFIFGQTNDEQYLASLDAEPGVIWRSLDGRYALTRVRRGEPDADGRATLRFETLLLGREHVSRVLSQLARVVCGNWKIRDGQADVVPAESSPGRLHPEIVSDAALSAESRQRLVAPAERASLRDVEAIVQRRFGQGDFSLAFKSLNEHVMVGVNLVAKSNTRTTSAAQPRTASARSIPRGRVAALSRGSAQNTLLVIVLCVALVNTVLTVFVMTQGVSGGDTPVSDAQNEILGRLDNLKRFQTDELKAAQAVLDRRFNEKAESVEGKIKAVTDDLARLRNEAQETRHRLLDKLASADAAARDLDQELRELLTSELDRLDQETAEYYRRVSARFNDLKASFDQHVKWRERAVDLKNLLEDMDRRKQLKQWEETPDNVQKAVDRWVDKLKGILEPKDDAQAKP